MTWEPLHPKHAIERARIIVRFSSALPEKFLRKLSVDGEDLRLQLGFTSKNFSEGQKITVDSNGASVDSQNFELMRWDWQKLSSANTPLETLVVEKTAMIYETVEYSRWKTFLDRFKQTALPTIETIADVVHFEIASLEYVDRFIFNGEPQDAKPNTILKGVTNQLHPDAESGKELWHLYRGWFEHIKEEKILVNQNIDARDERRSLDEIARNIQIYTKTELRFDQLPFDYSRFNSQLDNMHERSKEILKSILTDDAQNKIGLGGTET